MCPSATAIASAILAPRSHSRTVVDAFSNGATTFHVTTFAWFIVKSYNHDTVTGMFIRTQAQPAAICPTASNPNNPCPIGARDVDGMTVIGLSG